MIALRKLIVFILLIAPACQLSAQYYLRGEIGDDKNQPLQNVKIYMHTGRMLYRSGTTGGFGISTPLLYDSITFSLEGFEPQTIKIKSDVYQHILLKPLDNNSATKEQKVINITINQQQKFNHSWFVSDESYNNLVENDFIKTISYPATAFAIGTDKASYSNIRRFINQESVIPPDAVRIEEMLNYFNLNYKEPEKNEVFKIESHLTSCPWDTSHQLLFLNFSARKINLEKVPPSNFVFLIDISGSMDMPNRLPLLKGAFESLVKNLRQKDTVSIVIYGGSVGVWLQPTCGNEKQKIIKSIEDLTPGGSTPGEAAIKTAYTIARRSFIKGGNNRIILATDGDFNIGQTNEKELEQIIENERKSGVYLTCLGVGMGNYKDSKIEALAKKGNGNFAYIDDVREGEKVLVTELSQTLYTVANDVWANIEFNPALVQDFRLIGYDNKKNMLSDSSAQLEGGEVGSGNGITSIFEIIPNYDSSHVNYSSNSSKNYIAKVSLNYKLPIGDGSGHQLKYDCSNNLVQFKDLDNELKFASAVTMFGLILRQSKYLENANLKSTGLIATGSANNNDYIQEEFVSLIEKAKTIYTKKKKKKHLFN